MDDRYREGLMRGSAWFLAGWIAASLTFLITTTTPDEALDNIRLWLAIEREAALTYLAEADADLILKGEE